MNDDFKKLLFRVVIGFIMTVAVFLTLAVLWSCGFDFKCQKAVAVVGTPIPTLIPATMPAPVTDGVPNEFAKCEVKAMDLLGAWVDAGAPEGDPFSFADVNGNPCEGSFSADVWPLLNENNVWYPASLSCTSCHNTAFKPDTGGLDLTSYAGIMAGSQRESAEVATGTPILASSWTASLLYQNLSLTENIPLGHATLAHPATELVVFAGVHVQPEATPVP
jgi:hypothetical protein